MPCDYVVQEGGGKCPVRRERQLKAGMGSDGHSWDSHFQGKMELATNAQSVQFYRYEDIGFISLFSFPFVPFCFTIFLFFMSCVHSVLITFTYPSTRFAFCCCDNTQTKTNLGREGLISA